MEAERNEANRLRDILADLVRERNSLRDRIETLQAELANTQVAFNDWKVMHSTVRLEAETQRLRDRIEDIAADTRRAALQEAANVCDDLRQPRGWSAESNDWIEGTEDCAAEIRALIEKGE
jgi:predicted nuclease with TOPRIM domain